jgi:hypothetical protein
MWSASRRSALGFDMVSDWTGVGDEFSGRHLARRLLREGRDQRKRRLNDDEWCFSWLTEDAGSS